jgi:hypothetical protein
MHPPMRRAAATFASVAAAGFALVGCDGGGGSGRNMAAARKAAWQLRSAIPSAP